ncbi:hypothetical protein HDV00_012155 [Rhizophlyctis rosea]|nr:hypothetical protein HDV00_012155 [Rhizophlyctis rosea]
MEVEKDIDVAFLHRGDVVLVRPASNVPADGTVILGKTEVDESMLTGEALPVPKLSGSQVLGGSITTSGIIVFKITRTPTKGFLSGNQKLVAEAQSSRAPTQALAYRIASMFTPVVLVLASLTFFIWLGLGVSGKVEPQYGAGVDACCMRLL